ncbi:MAG: flippase [Bacteroidetes bacterium]|nr:flippase [Bacteroidota bacterium]
MSLSRIFSHFLFKTGAEAISRLAMFYVILMLTSRMGAEGYGAWSSVYSFLSLFIVIADLGLNLVLVRDVNQAPEKFPLYSRKLLRAKLFLSLAFGGLALSSSFLISWTQSEQTLIYAMTGFLITGTWVEFVQHLLWSKDDQRVESIVKTGNRLLVAIGSVAGILQNSMELALYYSIIANLLTVGFGWIRVMKHKSIQLANSEKPVFLWKDVWAKALPVSLTAFLVVLYLRVDVVMLKFFRDDLAEIGQYTAVMKIQDLVHTVAVIGLAALFPTLNRLWARDRKKLPDLLSKVLKYVLLFTTAVAVGGFLTAPDLLPVIFGPQFSDGAGFARILWWGLIPMGMNLIFLNLLLIAGKTKLNLIFTLISVSVNVVVNLLLIPDYGAIGAAWATLIAEWVLWLLLIINIRAVVAFRFKIGFRWKWFVPVLAMAGLLILTDHWPVITRVVAGGFVFLASLFSFRIADKMEMSELKNLVEEPGQERGLPDATN